MAVFQSLREFIFPPHLREAEYIASAPPTTYEIKPLTNSDLKEVVELNARCFINGENYTRNTFKFLLADPATLSYQVITKDGKMAGFVFVMMNQDGVAHVTTIAVAPEHRRRGLARRLLEHLEIVLKEKHVSTVVLEVRVSNASARSLYLDLGFTTLQRLVKYYRDGEDAYLMSKSIV